MKTINVDLLDYILDKNHRKVFLEEDFDRQPLLGKSSFIDRLMSFDDFIRELSSSSIPDKYLKVRLPGAPENMQLKNSDLVDGSFIHRRIRDKKWSAIFSATHHYLSTDRFTHYLREVERTYNAVVLSNIFYTHKSNAGLPIHWDTHNNCSFQLKGEKKWEIFAPVIDKPLPNMNLNRMPHLGLHKLEKVAEFTLKEGDCLYLPRGFGHKVSTETDISVHVTFGLHPVTYHDALEAAHMNALNDCLMQEEFRESIAHCPEKINELLGLYQESFLRSYKLTGKNSQQVPHGGDIVSCGKALENKDKAKVMINYPDLTLVENKLFQRIELIVGSLKGENRETVHLPDYSKEFFQRIMNHEVIPLSEALRIFLEPELYMLEAKRILSFQLDN